ncbi:IPT/TIG domain-containing protein [Larkinella punicea]|uniref:Cell shape determination protein CcmA n=1 Tax=Larkinella punicea TaxID=2315727 RepID=A0A368JCX3_9BACT|nr:IPT/TIG domain-containing protein [Larkinella punicea]RCR65518.1 cell shape determination protein CcmA [Larkinella punicea]
MTFNRFKQLAGLSFVTLLTGLTMTACEEDTDGRPQYTAGTPVATKLAPDSAAGGTVVTLTGSGLGDMRSIVFEKDNVPAGFQPTLNTDQALIFRVPDEVVGGVQNVIFTNSEGRTVSVPFRVLAYPTVSEVSNYNFTKDSEITITGNNLDDVTSVKLTGTSDAATIVSKEKKKLVVKMPATTVNRATLDITNSTGLFRTTQEMVNKDKAYMIFGDTYGAGFQDGSWGDAGAVSTTEFKSGTASVGKNFQKGNWHLIAFANWSASAISYSADYTYVSGWIKGASADYSLYLTTDASKAGFGGFDDKNKIDVKAGVWTYFKIKLSDVDFWSAGKKLTQVGFRIQGPDAKDETFYFDDLMLIK